jgi:hypothetical protein
MNQHSRRYLFIDYDNLLQVKFKKLEKVASKIFVFIEAQQETVPLSLAQQIQRLGRNLRWIVVDSPEGENLNFHIAFVMGKFHQKLEMDVEFAVVSHDVDFDTLVGFINASGRSCIRVKRSKDGIASLGEEDDMIEAAQEIEEDSNFNLDFLRGNENMDVLVEDEIIGRTAEETVKRLIRSGNRPAEVSSLKKYILLHNQELSLQGHLDRIIQKMKDSRDIDIQKGEVIYNF